MSNKLLTALELKVMNILWDKRKAFVKEIVDAWNEAPPPAYNTISTVIRILEEKEFAGHEAFGRTHRYFPLVSRKNYQKMHIKSVIDNVFSGSLQSLISTIVDTESVSGKELEDLKALIEKSEEEKDDQA